jgi:drug/metabolite transporter (DMT)-like permease
VKSASGKSNRGFYFLLLLVPLFWGGVFPAGKHIIAEVPPITTAAVRFGLAGLVLLSIVWAKGEWNGAAVKRQWRGLVLLALTGIFAYNVFFFVALRYTSAVNGSLIMATSPVFITLGAVLFLKERWNPRLGIGLTLSLTGVCLVVLGGLPYGAASFSFNVGDLLFLGALGCWVLHGLIGKVVMQDLSPLLTTTVSTVIGSLLLVLCSLPEKGWRSVISLSAQGWAEMLYMMVCATVIAFLLWNEGIHRIGAGKASLYMNLVPINATWMAVFLYGTLISWQQFAGMGLVIAGVSFVMLDGGVKKLFARQVG